MRHRLAFVGMGIALLATVLAVSVSSCTQNSTEVAVRSFELARQVDFVCMQVYAHFADDPEGTIRAIPPIPAPPGNCAPVPADTDGTFFSFHLYALVTQLTRGEVAVVDLTAGTVIDIDRGTPGINFLPVGGQPTDIAVAPDGKMTFVAAAEPNKAAIYGIANRDALGDSQQLSELGTRPIPKLTTWPVCALIAVIPRVLSGDIDAGGPAESAYEVAVVLPGEGGRSSKLITLDPKPFLRGSDPVGTGAGDGGVPEGDRLEPSPGPRLEPGSLADCPITSAIELSGELPSAWKPGPEWDNGIRNALVADGGAASLPAQALPPTPGCVDEAPPGGDAGAGDAGAGEAGVPEYPFPSAPQASPMGTSAARDGQVLYVADGALPMIHVFDLSVAGKPTELAPLLATSQYNPDRRVTVGQIAVSPPTRDFKKYLYAIDRKEGSIMVFDVTDPATSSHVPLTRPNAETNPYQTAVDRISFGAPVASLSFVRHDFSPRNPLDGTLMTAGTRGALCNPNSSASPDPAASNFDPGTLFREGAVNQDPNLLLGPSRLRGIFAFATLSNGNMMAIDVDDWDAPCRRPEDMQEPISSITPAQAGAAGGAGPYQAPVATGMTNEIYFPMTAPNRARSQYLTRFVNSLGQPDSVGLGHVPVLDSRPQLVVNGTTVPILEPDGVQNALMVPTKTDFFDWNNPFEHDPNSPTPPAAPGVRFSYETPEVHIDQDWAVVYEGILPGMDGFQGALEAPDNTYETMTLSQPAAAFCRKGVEDLRVSSVRAAAEAPERAKLGLLAEAAPLDRHLVDYVQISDDLLDVSDAYWSQYNSCWDGPLASAPKDLPNADLATARHDLCAVNFGNYTDEVQPNATRDFPILEAYDDHLVLGAFSYARGSQGLDPGRRVAESKGSFNVTPLRQAQCCFHNEAHFKVRTGGQWVTVGGAVGYLNHMTKDATGACVSTCTTRDRLLNARVPALPYPCNEQNGTCTTDREKQDQVPLIDRNSPLAMRNPAMSFVIYNGRNGTTDVPPVRDAQYRFATRGGYVDYTLNLASTTTAVSPQSMRFVEAFQQLAIIDGAAQGLMLIDLNNVTLAHSPYF